MSEAPVLTPQQQKKSLSSRKARAKNYKQVLINPHSTQYRPNVSPTENETLLNLISTIPRLVPKKTQVPWATIKEVSKENRKEFRSLHQDKLPPQNNIRRKLIFGINKVTTNLENNNLEVVLITSDINPFFMVQHVIELCVIGKIPVLIIQDLRQELTCSLGIASTCLGIASKCKDDIVKNLTDTIKCIYQNYSPPDDYVFKLTNQSYYIINDVEVKNTKIVEDSKEVETMCDNVNVVQMIRNKVSHSILGKHHQKGKKVDEEDCNDLHLARVDAKSRVYVPKRVAKNREFNADFVRFSVSEAVLSKNYIGLQVAKLKSNNRRNHRGFHLDKTVGENKQKQKLQPNKFKEATKKDGIALK